MARPDQMLRIQLIALLNFVHFPIAKSHHSKGICIIYRMVLLILKKFAH